MQAEAGAPLRSQAGDDATDSATVRPHRRSLFWVVLAIATVWVTTDQVTKNIAEDVLSDGSTRPFIGELLQFHLTYNPGAAFSMGTGSTGLLTVLAVTVCIVIVWNARRLGSMPWAIGLGLLLGGALGNLTDRLTREPGFGKGHVVDFLMLPNFPIFNIADIGITSAAVLIGLLALRGINPDGTRVADEKDSVTKNSGKEQSGDKRDDAPAAASDAAEVAGSAPDQATDAAKHPTDDAGDVPDQATDTIAEPADDSGDVPGEASGRHTDEGPSA